MSHSGEAVLLGEQELEDFAGEHMGEEEQGHFAGEHMGEEAERFAGEDLPGFRNFSWLPASLFPGAWYAD